MNKIGIGIPIYDDYENLKLILDEIKKLKIDYIDFYVLDNGSHKPRLEEYRSKYGGSNINFFATPKNLGFGGGIKYLIDRIPNEYIGWMPGNYKVRPSELIKISDHFENLTTQVFFKAHRIARSKTAALKTLIGNGIISALFLRNIQDSGGTPTIIHRNYRTVLFSGPDDFSFEAYCLYVARVKKWKIIRLDINYLERVHGQSHWQKGMKSEIKLTMRILSQRKAWKKIARQEQY